MDIQYKTDEGMFNCRVVGVCVKNNKILLSRAKTEDYWSFVGGKPKFGEATDKTIVREYEEEIGIKLDVERLVSVIENFFELDGHKWHQYIFFYLLKDSNNQLKEFEGEQKILDNDEGVYKWFSIDELKNIKTKPDCLENIIKNIPNEILHCINKDKS
ncbi:MAG: NUDIX hydrolase [Clostridium sp.]